jgi:peptidoglycan hydrolase CwlO-like protein
MNILIKYNEENKKVLIKMDETEFKELDFSTLLDISNKVIDDGVILQVNTEGFENFTDIEENYKNIFSQIEDLKNNSEIKELKEKLGEQQEKVEEEAEKTEKSDLNFESSSNDVAEEDPLSDFF